MSKGKKVIGIIAFLICTALLSAAVLWQAPATAEVPAAANRSEKTLIVGGQAFGVKFYTQGVIVVDLSEFETETGARNPAKEAGLRVGDVIRSVDRRIVSTNGDIAELVEESGGAPLEIEYSRGGEPATVTVAPLYSPPLQSYKLGLWVRDSTAGVGTVTYIDPDTGRFGALGHGISDVDTGLLMPLSDGEVLQAQIVGVATGKRGMPGQLKGAFVEEMHYGALDINSDQGVFGFLDDRGVLALSGQAIPVARAEEVHTGRVTIRSTISGTQPEEFEAVIETVNGGGAEIKNFVLRITDERLLAATGGIVQGMSGSPVLQDGKLIGAVTHVLVNDPTMGYGIFLENMLKTDSGTAAIFQSAA